MQPDPAKPISQLRLYQRTIAEIKVKNAWASEFPKISSDAIDEITAKLITKGASQAEIGGMLSKAIAMEKREREHLEDMLEKRFTPEQIHLFVHSSPTDRNELAQAWLKGVGQRMKENAAKAPNAIGMATDAVLAGGSAGSLVFMVAGMAIGNIDLADSGRIILGMIADAWTGIDTSKVHLTAKDQMIAGGIAISTGVALISVCLKSSATIFQELLKSDPALAPQKAKRALEDSVIGEFFRMDGEHFQTPKGPITQDQAGAELETIPGEYLPLLTHLKPGELVAFLGADDEGRESMMRVNPPGREQKFDTVRALHSGKMRRAWELARQSLHAWEGAFSPNGERDVTLGSSLAAMREARVRAKKQVLGGQGGRDMALKASPP